MIENNDTYHLTIVLVVKNFFAGPEKGSFWPELSPKMGVLAIISTLAHWMCSILHMLVTLDSLQLLNDVFCFYQNFKL